MTGRAAVRRFISSYISLGPSVGDLSFGVVARVPFNHGICQDKLRSDLS